MLNTGLLLSKPGESGYSKYRRFLIANKDSKLNTTEMITELQNIGIKYNSIESKPFKIKSHQLSSMVLDYEKSFIKNINKNHNCYSSILFNRYKPIKNCMKCSEIGYHSELFDFSWIKTCPIHKEELINHCHFCKGGWPGITHLFNNKCSHCGTNINYEKLIDRHFLKHQNKYDVIEKLLLKIRTKDSNQKFNYEFIFSGNQNQKRENANQVSIIFHS